jgi:hypothetical protein
VLCKMLPDHSFPGTKSHRRCRSSDVDARRELRFGRRPSASNLGKARRVEVRAADAPNAHLRPRAKLAKPCQTVSAKVALGTDAGLAVLGFDNVLMHHYTNTMKIHHNVTPRQEAFAERNLCTVLAALRTPEECRAFLRDLCTPAELQAMADRWTVGRLPQA